MALLAALAVLRVHVAVIEAPGRRMLRSRAESALRARGWTVAAPSDADLLLVCGEPAGGAAEWAEEAWAQVEPPRLRTVVREPDELTAALDAAERALGAAPRAARGAGSAPFDAAAVRFGPGLPGWPGELVVTCGLEAERVRSVRVRRFAVAAETDAAGPAEQRLVVACEDAARVLRAAGWRAPALRLDRIVDRVLAGGQADRQRGVVRAVARSISRSATFTGTSARVGADLRADVLRALAAADRDPGDAEVPLPPLDADAIARRVTGARPRQVPLLVLGAAARG